RRRRIGACRVRRVAGRQEGDRHRQLLHRFVEVQRHHRMEADGPARRWLAPDGRLLSRTPRRVPRHEGSRSARMTATPRVPFLSLVPGEDAADVRRAIDRVVDRGWFVLGPEVDAFEAEFAAAMGAAHAVGVGNGTDAIALILRALGIGAGDEVITTAVSAAYSALAVMMAGARPVF